MEGKLVVDFSEIRKALALIYDEGYEDARKELDYDALNSIALTEAMGMIMEMVNDVLDH